MKAWYARFAVAMSVAAVLSLAACEKSSKNDSGSSGAVSSKPSGKVIAPGDAPFSDVLADAGFNTILFKRFPAQLPGRKASIVVYRHKSDKKKGGILYLQGRTRDQLKIVWHWYFTDGAPDSIQAAELNDDGLWDVIVHFPGGKTRELLQDTDFTLTASPRDDLIALNASSSRPDGLWRCFDGDSATAWLAGGNKGYVEIPTPLGVRDGILVVRLPADAKAQSIEVHVDGKKLQVIELEGTGLEQRIQLDPAVKEASTIKLVIKGDDVGISELAIR